MAVLSPPPKWRAVDNNGDPLVGGKLYTYEVGTTTPKATYTTAAASVANTNPVILDSRGEADIFFSGSYKMVLTDANGATIWSKDSIVTSSSNPADGVFDSNNNELLTFIVTSLAVNNVEITNAATGNGPIIAAAGTDTNIPLNIKAKGTGDVNLIPGSTGDVNIVPVGGNVVISPTAGTVTVAPGGAVSVSPTSGNVAIAPASGAFTASPSGAITLTPGSGTVTINGQLVSDEILTIGGSSGVPASIRLSEDSDNGTNYIAVNAPANLAANRSVTLPSAAPTNTYLLTTDGSGVWSYTDPSTYIATYTPTTDNLHTAVRWDAPGSTISLSRNVSSVTDHGTGDFTVVETSATTSPIIIGLIQDSSVVNYTLKRDSSLRFKVYDTGGTTQVDPDTVDIAIHDIS